ncbi:hypothetical protein [Emcibacter sp. SYSU 3D8]|uniref:hypothetical protein n=1 Tax=Emcibacter sp. SYSU 3D8 TaxID=3133969 RepID=UPI0031FECBF8
MRIAAMALCLCLLAPDVQARGLLGLFAEEPPAPAPVAAPAPRPAQPAAQDRPVAWISGMRGASGRSAVLYGYVHAGDSIDLGTEGEITLTWLSPCREESIIGGLVSVTATGPQVIGAPASESRALSCQPLELLLPDGLSASPQEAPQAAAINTAEPVFVWPAARAASGRLILMDMAGNEPFEIWSARVTGAAAPYPHDAPPLREGRLYRVSAAIKDGVVYRALFTYDPSLRYSSAPINALVVLREGAAP